MKTKRSNYSAAFKARVALAAVKGDKTIALLYQPVQGTSHADNAVGKTVAGIGYGHFFPQSSAGKAKSAGTYCPVISADRPAQGRT